MSPSERTPPYMARVSEESKKVEEYSEQTDEFGEPSLPNHTLPKVNEGKVQKVLKVRKSKIRKALS